MNKELEEYYIAQQEEYNDLMQYGKDLNKSLGEEDEMQQT